MSRFAASSTQRIGQLFDILIKQLLALLEINRQMQFSSRFKIVLLICAALSLTGCAVKNQYETQRRLVSSSTLKEASLDQLLANLDATAAHLQTLKLTVEMDLSTGGERKGIVTDYRQVSGYVLVRKPEMLHMIVRAPVVGNRIVDMVSKGKTFSAAFNSPSSSKYFVGSNEVAHPSEKPLENMRPQHVLDALLIKPVDHAAGEVAVLEQSVDVVKDPKTHKEALRPNYVVFVISKDEAGSYLSRRIVFSRDDLMPHEQYLYDRQGQLVTIARYDYSVPVFTEEADTKFPGVIQIQRPVEEYSIKLTVEKASINLPLGDDQFEVAQPPGSTLINVDQKAARIPSEAELKADTKKPQ